MRALRRFDDFARWLGSELERRIVWVLWGFSVLYLAVTSLLAWRKLLWYDELFGLYISRLPSLSEVWSALLTGAEQLPPFFHIVMRASLALLGESPFSVRLPEMLAFWVMSLCLFWFVSRRSSPLYGCVAMLFPLLTRAYRYAYEARPYGLVLGLSALALLCWRAAAEKRRRPLALVGLAACLAAAVSSHYYAVLVLLPLAVGELVRSVTQRRLDLLVWAAFGAALAPLLFFLPLIRGARTYAATFWVKPRWSSMAVSYNALLGPIVLLLVAAVVVLAALRCRARLPDGPGEESGPRPRLPSHEVAAAVGFVGIPIVAVLLGMSVTGVFLNRYVLPAVIGFSILFSWVAHRLQEGRATVGVALVLVFCGWFVPKGAQELRKMTSSAADLAETYRFLQLNAEAGLPIVISQPLRFLQLAHYAPREIAPRLVYLADPEAALRHLRTDSTERALLELRRWAPVRVEPYSAFMVSQQQFLVYGPTAGRLEWLMSALDSESVRVEVSARRGENLLFLVSRRGSPADARQSRGAAG